MTAPDAAPGLTAKGTLLEALRDLRANWLRFTAAYVLYNAVAVALLMPLVALLARLLIDRSGSGALADAEIAHFFFTRKGLVALILVTALVIAVEALEVGCLMTLGLGRIRGAPHRLRDAFAHGTLRSFAVLRLTVLLVLRLLLVAIPYAAILGAAYWLLLRQYDINYYLSARPTAFWVAVAIGVVGTALLAFALGKRIANWVLVLPIVLFEDVLPIRAFAESANRIKGKRDVVLIALGVWAIASYFVSSFVMVGVQIAGRAIAPLFSSTMIGMYLFMGSYGVLWLAALVATGAATAAFFAMISVRLYLESGAPDSLRLPKAFDDSLEVEGRRFKISWPVFVGGLAAAVVVASLVLNLILRGTANEHPVLVFAHRGASTEAPENTVAAFKLAAEQHADFVELDVQEAADGTVLVNHDVDLMKDGRSPLKVWETPAEQLRTVDIGSSFAPRFSSERVPTLAEVLALCKGVIKVDIELKDYGHDVQLEERVIALVEAAGMTDQIVSMSLSPKMVLRMKELRPQWTAGLLAARSIGDPRQLPGDFLAVQSATATRAFIRKAHSAGKPVYVWTVDDPQKMILYIGFGADGLITNKPALAKAVVAQYQGSTRVQRLFLFAMTRLGAHPEVTTADEDLRP